MEDICIVTADLYSSFTHVYKHGLTFHKMVLTADKVDLITSSFMQNISDVSKLLSPAANIISGRPKVDLLFWFLGDFRCSVLLFMVTLVVFNYKNRRK